ncbi:vWA domain-containing protein [Burkholderia vietnamiensis]|uniref:vWA domain-containing protein n=1 Tax=Burkholderia vietnamiensis TaxID=60552 RepID=UPI001CF29796|nr:VWA-like domain-containing protein [Burkholderia vietnamiensis]MCA8230589.1 VWA-like domain-containing protein [Burkholderia vietnamiensis]
MDSRIVKQRTALVLDHPFIGALALRLKVREDLSCKTFWTDGETLGYNPTYAERLNDLEVRGVLAHEVWHVAGGHCWRQGDRDPNGWNEACDYVVNLMVEAAGMQLPSGVLIDHRFKGMSAEEVYGVLSHEKRQVAKQPGGKQASDPPSGGKPGSLTGSPGSQPPQPSDDKAVGPAASCGEVRQYAGPDKAAKAAEWKVAVLQAAKAAQACGKLGGALQAAVEQSVAAVGDWRSLLHRFAQDAAPTDYTWAQPNRRYLHVGMYLPSLNEPAVGDAVFVRDASGSVWDETQAQFAAEILAVADAVRPRRLIVLDCDVRVTQVQVFERGEPAELAPLKGGGGTSFIDPFRWVKREEIDPAFLVYLTDMAGTFPSEAPAYAVLWASTTPLKRARRAPFGETIEVVC